MSDLNAVFERIAANRAAQSEPEPADESEESTLPERTRRTRRPEAPRAAQGSAPVLTSAEAAGPSLGGADDD